MSARQQGKKACFAARAKTYAFRMNRKYRGNPNYMGVTTHLHIEGMPPLDRGVMFAYPAASLKSKPLPNLPIFDMEHDPLDTDGPIPSLAMARTQSFHIKHDVVRMSTCGLPKTEYLHKELGQAITEQGRKNVVEITGKFSTSDVNYDALKLLFPDTDGV